MKRPHPHLAALASSALLLIGFPPLAGAESAEQLYEAVAQWVQLRSQLSAEKNAWNERQAILRDEQELIDRQIAELQSKLRTSQDAASEAENESRVLAETERRLEKSLRDLQVPLAAGLAEWRRLSRRLPTALQLPADAGGPAGKEQLEQSGETTRLLLQFYAELQAANQRFHAMPVMLTGPDGIAREMDALFLGTAVAFAVSRDARLAAVGRPREDSWSWEWGAAPAAQVRHALDIHGGDAHAELVTLPLPHPENRN